MSALDGRGRKRSHTLMYAGIGAVVVVVAGVMYMKSKGDKDETAKRPKPEHTVPIDWDAESGKDPNDTPKNPAPSHEVGEPVAGGGAGADWTNQGGIHNQLDGGGTGTDPGTTPAPSGEGTDPNPPTEPGTTKGPTPRTDPPDTTGTSTGAGVLVIMPAIGLKSASAVAREIKEVHNKDMHGSTLVDMTNSVIKALNDAVAYYGSIDKSRLDASGVERMAGWRSYMHQRKRVAAALYRVMDWRVRHYGSMDEKRKLNSEGQGNQVATRVPTWSGPSIGQWISSTTNFKHQRNQSIVAKSPQGLYDILKHDMDYANVCAWVASGRLGTVVDAVNSPKLSWLEYPETVQDAKDALSTGIIEGMSVVTLLYQAGTNTATGNSWMDGAPMWIGPYMGETVRQLMIRKSIDHFHIIANEESVDPPPKMLPRLTAKYIKQHDDLDWCKWVVAGSIENTKPLTVNAPPTPMPRMWQAKESIVISKAGMAGLLKILEKNNRRNTAIKVRSYVSSYMKLTKPQLITKLILAVEKAKVARWKVKGSPANAIPTLSMPNEAKTPDNNDGNWRLIHIADVARPYFKRVFARQGWVIPPNTVYDDMIHQND